MDTSPITGLVAACALIAACESQPAVTFVANGSEFNVISLEQAINKITLAALSARYTWAVPKASGIGRPGRAFTFPSPNLSP